MPVTMNGSPFKLKHDHWKEKDAEIFFGHELSSKQRRAKAEAEFQARQTERLRQEEVHRAYEKQKRDEMTAKLEKRLEFQPGYGPTRWMWPTAAKYPRTYRPAGDIHIDPADLCFTGGTHGGTNGSPLHDFKDGHDITERPGVERGPVGPMNPPWAQSPTPPGSARMLSASDMGRAGFAASTRSSPTRSPTGSPESPM